MKTLLVTLFLFIGISQAQINLTLASDNDTALVYNSYDKYYCFVTFQDTADSQVDTLRVKTKVGDKWAYLGLKDLQNDNVASNVLPGDGEVKIYLVNKPKPGQLIFELQTNGTATCEIRVEFVRR